MNTIPPDIASRDLTVYQGATWDDEFQYLLDGEYANFTGCKVELNATKSVPDMPAILSITTENGGIVVSDDGLTLRFNMPADKTMLLPAMVLMYDIHVTWSDKVTVWKIVSGKMRVVPKVRTR